jgi:hypothetical protein
VDDEPLAYCQQAVNQPAPFFLQMDHHVSSMVEYVTRDRRADQALVALFA